MNIDQCSANALPVEESWDIGDKLFWGYDFINHFPAASRLFWFGRNPYELCQYKAQMMEYGWHSTSQVAPFPYPPNALLMLGPFVPLNLTHQFILWYMILALSLWSIIGLLRKTYLPKAPLITVMIIVVAFPATFRMLMYGQATVLILLALILSITITLKNRAFFGGMLASLATIKPHLAALPLIGLSIEFYRSQRKSWVYGLILGLAIQFAACALINPTATFSYIQSLPVIAEHHETLQLEQALRGFAAQLPSIPYLLVFTAAVSMLITISTAFSSAFLLEQKLAIYLSLVFLFIPYFWLHDIFIVLPCFLILLAQLKLSLPLCGGGLILLLAAGQGFLLPSPNEKLWRIAVILLLAAVYVILLRRQSHGREISAS